MPELSASPLEPPEEGADDGGLHFGSFYTVTAPHSKYSRLHFASFSRSGKALFPVDKCDIVKIRENLIYFADDGTFCWCIRAHATDLIGSIND